MRDKLRNIILVLVLILAAPASWATPSTAIPEPKAKPFIEAALQPAVTAAPAPRIAPSGLPVPRWVSIKAGRVNVRRGPSFDQDVVWVYVRPGVPVEIIAEFDTWRRIRDASGETGWVKAAMVEARRNVIVTGRVNTAMLSAAKADAEVVAYAAPGLQARLKGCSGEWCEISARGFDGFVTRDRLWGVYSDDAH